MTINRGLPSAFFPLDDVGPIALFPVAPPTDNHIGGGLGEAPRPPVGVWGQAPNSWFLPTQT
jgi:hypothetical protein